jgi:hypothetical protein
MIGLERPRLANFLDSVVDLPPLWVTLRGKVKSDLVIFDDLGQVSEIESRKLLLELAQHEDV